MTTTKTRLTDAYEEGRDPEPGVPTVAECARIAFGRGRRAGIKEAIRRAEVAADSHRIVARNTLPPATAGYLAGANALAALAADLRALSSSASGAPPLCACGHPITGSDPVCPEWGPGYDEATGKDRGGCACTEHRPVAASGAPDDAPATPNKETTGHE
jgi:hypothetical protein